MTQATLEHVNMTVSNPEKTAEMLCDLFDWKIRWEGDAIHGGRSIHVGSDDSYIAIYRGKEDVAQSDVSYYTIGGLNHIAIVVDDLEAVELKVRERGLITHSHANYEPGKRFYFQDHDGIEIEVVNYD
ncbi:MAG: VOC family protein [Rhizobiaceae bacterium]|nr:VOC family protein [Rhizobiaceae bacterium]